MPKTNYWEFGLVVFGIWHYNETMKKFWFQMIGLVVLILAATFLAFNQKYLTPLTKLFIQQPENTGQDNLGQVSIIKILSPDGVTKAQLKIELADNKEKRNQGLGNRASLATDSGMLFIHDETSVLTYWMKGMEFPIDFIWIKDDMVVDIIPNAAPPVPGQKDETLVRYAPTVPVNKVLETNAGFASENNIQKGDKIIVEASN
jgi:uncharacterized protein